MRLEEFEQGGEQRRIADLRAQGLGIEAGQRKEALGALLVGQRPGERLKADRGGDIGVDCLGSRDGLGVLMSA